MFLLNIKFNSDIIFSRMLAAASRSRVSIRGRPRKNLPRILFDPRAKFGVVSYTVCAHKGPKKLGDAGATPPWGVGVARVCQHQLSLYIIIVIVVAIYPKVNNTKYIMLKKQCYMKSIWYKTI